IKVPFTDISFFALIDLASTNYMLPIGGLFTVIFIGWVIKDKVRLEELKFGPKTYFAFKIVVRFLTPLAILIVLLHGLKLLPFVDF
ncbi:MAG: hypothetical protein DRP47_11740, partial [Candidatus Zixiibacteriota bacterium]